MSCVRSCLGGGGASVRIRCGFGRFGRPPIGGTELHEAWGAFAPNGVVGVLLASMFVLGFILAFMEGFQAGYDAMDAVVVIVFSTVAAAHIAAGVGVWRGHRWGVVLGIAFAIIGLLFSLLGLLEEWFAILPAAGYTAALVGLLRTSQAWWPGPSRS